MDIQRFTRKTYRLNVAVALVMSGLVVTFASLLGRGVLQIKGALIGEEPTELTVSLLVEPYELTPSEILSLPKRADAHFRYTVTTASGTVYFVTVDKDGPPWKLRSKPEKLHRTGADF